MTTDQSVQRDERTVAVENASYKWAGGFVVFALLLDGMCRAVFRNEAAWDLLALAIAPGVICTIYQAHHKTASRWMAVFMVCSARRRCSVHYRGVSIPSSALTRAIHGSVRTRRPCFRRQRGRYFALPANTGSHVHR